MAVSATITQGRLHRKAVPTTCRLLQACLLAQLLSCVISASLRPHSRLLGGSLDAVVGTGLLTGLAEASAARRASLALQELGYEPLAPPMIKVLLHGTQARCNDNSQAGYYVRKSINSKKWVVFLEGGWYCFDQSSCGQRWLRLGGYMTSRGWPATRQGTGVLDPLPEHNPHWWRYNHVFVPYCSSDAWSGRQPSSLVPIQEQSSGSSYWSGTGHAHNLTSQLGSAYNFSDSASIPVVNRDPEDVSQFSFLGSVIVTEVIKDIVQGQGLGDGHTLMLAGSSAGAIGVLLNVDRVASLLPSLGVVGAEVRGVVDSGWFVDNTPYRPMQCLGAQSCPPLEAIRRGLPMWGAEVAPECARHHAPEACFLGYRLYPTIKAPLFIFQWLFDEAQMLADNLPTPATQVEWNYIHSMGARVRQTLANVTTLFAPSCIAHTVLSRPDWTTIKIGTVTLPQALHCWASISQEELDQRKLELHRGQIIANKDNTQQVVTSKERRETADPSSSENNISPILKRKFSEGSTTDTRIGNNDGESSLGSDVLTDREIRQEQRRRDNRRRRKRKRHSRRRCRSQRRRSRKRKQEDENSAAYDDDSSPSSSVVNTLQDGDGTNMNDGMLADSPNEQSKAESIPQASFLQVEPASDSQQKLPDQISTERNVFDRAEMHGDTGDGHSPLDRRRKPRKNRRKHKKHGRRRNDRQKRKRKRTRIDDMGSNKRKDRLHSGKTVRAIRDVPHAKNRVSSRSCATQWRHPARGRDSTETTRGNLGRYGSPSGQPTTSDTKPRSTTPQIQSLFERTSRYNETGNSLGKDIFPVSEAVHSTPPTLKASSTPSSEDNPDTGESLLRGVDVSILTRDGGDEGTCHQQLSNLCTWPHCNPTCPKLIDPITGDQITFSKLLQSFGLDMANVARELGMDLHSLTTMEDNALLLLLTQ